MAGKAFAMERVMLWTAVARSAVEMVEGEVVVVVGGVLEGKRDQSRKVFAMVLGKKSELVLMQMSIVVLLAARQVVINFCKELGVMRWTR